MNLGYSNALVCHSLFIGILWCFVSKIMYSVQDSIFSTTYEYVMVIMVIWIDSEDQQSNLSPQTPLTASCEAPNATMSSAAGWLAGSGGPAGSATARMPSLQRGLFRMDQNGWDSHSLTQPGTVHHLPKGVMLRFLHSSPLHSISTHRKLPAPWTTCVKHHPTKVVKVIAHVRIKQHSRQLHSYYLEAAFEIRKQKYQIQVDHTTPERRYSLFKLTILLNDCWLLHPKNIKKKHILGRISRPSELRCPGKFQTNLAAANR